MHKDFLLIFTLLSWQIVLGKLAEKFITISPESQWEYISKFTCDPGKGSWELKAKIHRPSDLSSTQFLSLETSIYLDTNWDETLSFPACKDKLSSSKGIKNVKIPLNGDWSELIKGTFSQTSPHVWFFALSNCNATINNSHEIRVEMHFLNSDKSEFSTEDKDLLLLYIAIFIVFALTLSRNIYHLIKVFKQTSEITPNLMMLNSAILIEFFGLVFEVAHLLVYYSNGKGWIIFDFFYHCLFIVSGLVVSFLFLIMADGWSLKYKDFPNFEELIPILLLQVLINILFVGFSKVIDDSYYKFSDFEGIPGALMLIFKICIWCWFIFTIKSQFNSLPPRKASFLMNFSVLVSFYLLGLPLLVSISWQFKNYLRNRIVKIGYNLIQILVYFLLTHLFSDKSNYYKISTLSESSLPGKRAY
ncbi:unnamed protein product [Blepharisma stoltei]|uniref:GPR180/TMEM145 transmembrane domain-containing protein n=1 Tax=Blepharisma stoltei TaxID=1481888 RepID=A0AAU9IQH6_9CILI|nr:unnamed protein product [Blepharisma stoltei]